jgi:hypothetical protein
MTAPVRSGPAGRLKVSYLARNRPLACVADPVGEPGEMGRVSSREAERATLATVSTKAWAGTLTLARPDPTGVAPLAGPNVCDAQSAPLCVEAQLMLGCVYAPASGVIQVSSACQPAPVGRDDP